MNPEYGTLATHPLTLLYCYISTDSHYSALFENCKSGGVTAHGEKTGSSEFFLGDLAGFNPTLLDISSHLPAPATGFAEACAVYLGDGVVGVLGGFADTDALLKTFDTYNTITGQWKRLAGMTRYSLSSLCTQQFPLLMSMSMSMSMLIGYIPNAAINLSYHFCQCQCQCQLDI